MLLTHVKKSISYKAAQGFKLPDDDVLQDTLFEAMLYVASVCKPKELVASIEADAGTVFRLIEGGKYIRYPEYPDFTQTVRHLQMDEQLSYSVINYTCFLLTKNILFKQIADELIAVYSSSYSDELYGDEQ